MNQLNKMKVRPTKHSCYVPVFQSHKIFAFQRNPVLKYFRAPPFVPGGAPLVIEGRHTRQLLALKQLQGCTATSAAVCNLPSSGTLLLYIRSYSVYM